MKDDAALSGLFGWNQENGEGIRVEVGGQKESGASLAESKLYKTAARLESWPQGTVTYRNQVWKKELTVEGGGSLLPVSFPGLRRSGSNFKVMALVTEPAEWVRSFELIRYYRDKFKNQGAGSETYREKASNVLKGKVENGKR